MTNSTYPKRIRICDGQELNAIYKSGPKTYQSELYNLIWAKLEKEIPEGAMLSFAPSGLINILNIEAAQNHDGKRACDIRNEVNEIDRLT